MMHLAPRAVARVLIGGRGGSLFIYSYSARLITFEMNLKTTDFKRNSLGRTRIYEYTASPPLPPPPPINALATALLARETCNFSPDVQIHAANPLR